MLGKYTIRLRKHGAYEPSFCYLIDSLLQSRIATRNESNKDFYDEDANIYIAHLLNSIVNQRFQEMTARYVVDHEADLRERVGDAESPLMKFSIYRANADYLLVRSGLFHVPGEDVREDRQLLALEERGRTYYRFASSFTDVLPGRYRSVGHVLAKLSYDFTKYREVLSFMRGEFLGLVEPLTEKECESLYQEMDAKERAERIRKQQDALLDAYLQYQKDRGDESRRKLEKELRLLQELDPDSWPTLDLGNETPETST